MGAGGFRGEEGLHRRLMRLQRALEEMGDKKDDKASVQLSFQCFLQ